MEPTDLAHLDHDDTLAPVDPERLASALAPLSPNQRVDYLISQPNAAGHVAALAPWSLYHLIKEVGESDCVELIHLASDEQTQALIDLECWQRDHLNVGRLEHWFELLLQQPDDEDNLRRQLRAIDPEVVVAMMMNHLTVFVLDEDGEPPPELVDLGRPWETSPDGYYLLVFDDDEDAARLIRRFLDLLYHVDFAYARTLLEAQRAEMLSNIEEVAFTVRVGRMEEMGFSPWEEAIGLYAADSPEAARRRVASELERADRDLRPRHAEPILLPTLYHEQVSDRHFLFQAIAEAQRRAGSGDSTFDATVFQNQLIGLTNKAMAAEPVEPGDLEASKRVFQRVAGYISIGLQYCADMDLGRAVELLEAVHPHHLFRAGFALTLGLKAQAERMVAGGGLRETLTLTDQPLSLVPETSRVVLNALLAARPEYGDPDTGFSEPFTDIGQIHKTAVRVSLTAFEVMAVFGILGFDRATVAHTVYEDTAWPPVELVDLHTLLRTVLIHRCLQHDPEDALRPLSTAELAAFIAGPLTDARALLDRIGPEPRSVAALAALDETACARALFKALTTGDPLEAQALPVVRTVVRRIVESLVEMIGDVTASELKRGETLTEHLGNVALLKD